MKFDIEERRRNYFRDKPDRTLLFFLLIAVAIYVGFLHGSKQHYSYDHWIETSGNIQSIEIRPNPPSGKIFFAPWQLEISYSYTVEGAAYTGTNYSASGNLKSGYYEDLEEIAARYPRGAQVKVYYDPDDKRNAVLVK